MDMVWWVGLGCSTKGLTGRPTVASEQKHEADPHEEKLIHYYPFDRPTAAGTPAHPPPAGTGSIIHALSKLIRSDPIQSNPTISLSLSLSLRAPHATD